MLLQGGELNGHRVFEPRTVWRATSEQSYGELDFTLGVPLRYGMGFMLGGEWLSLYGFDSQHAFGHLGLTNIVGWADPQRHLSVGIMTSGKPVVYPEMHRGLQLIYTIASSCPKDPDVAPRLREEPRARPKTQRRGDKPAKARKTKRAGRVVKKRGKKAAESVVPTRKAAPKKKRAKR
jgi:CubicO group peptidase (beta-lactamase class C family)